MKSTASVKPILYTSKTLSNGEHPIRIRVIKDRKARYVSIGHSTKKEWWDKKAAKPNKKHPYCLDIEMLLNKKVNEINRDMLAMDTEDVEYTVDTITTNISKKRLRLKVFEYFDNVIAFEKEGGKIRTAETYRECKNILFTFCENKELLFSEIDFTFLKKFENYLKGRGNKDITIHYYMRTLRALFNRGIKQNFIKESNYPFKFYKLSDLNLETAKRALSEKDINQIINLKIAKYTKLWDAHNIFVFSYYTMGTNFVDIANLKWDDVENERLNYRRAKTGQLITLSLLPKAIEIINEYRSIKTSQYVFPIFSDEHDTPLKRHYRKNKLTGQINKELKEIARLCDLKVNLTTYVARHSAATILKRKGASTAMISDLLGHETEEITQTYLDSFENADLDKVLSLL